MKSVLGFGVVGALCAVAASASVASAAEGESFVTGSVGDVIIKSVGNFKAGAFYTDNTQSSYSQWGYVNDSQSVSLNALSRRVLQGYLHDKAVPVVYLWASSNGRRQSNHMTGSTSGRIEINGNIVWEDDDDFDVTAWSGSEAEVTKTQQIFSHSKSYTALIPVGPASVNLKGTLSGSVSLSATASSNFSPTNGRQGRAFSTTGASAKADLHAEATFGVPYVAGLGVYSDINVITVTVPTAAVATWDWNRSRPVESANHYTCVAVNNITGETGGGVFGAKLLGPLNLVIAQKQLADWKGAQLFDHAFTNESMSDVGRYE